MAGAAYYFCSAELPREICRRTRALFLTAAAGPPPPNPAPAGTIYTCPMHPQIRQAGPGNCPICGMTLEPETVTADYRPQRRTDRHDAALLDRIGSRGPGCRARNGRASHQSAYVAFARRFELDRARAGDAGRAVGGLAVLRAGMGVAHEPQSQHVHADRHGHGRRLGLQRGRNGCARPVPAGFPGNGRRGRRSISRRRRRSPSSCCSARCSNCARANRPAARSGPCSTLRRRPRAASAPTAPTRKSASKRSRSAIGCASGPAKRSRSTAS